jgi:hypothetical protein
MLLGAAPGARERQTAGADHPGRAEVERALETVRADPNLATERTIKTLRWRKPADLDATTPARPRWLGWIAGLLRWLEQSGRLFFWGTAVVAAGFLAAYVTRLFRATGTRRSEEAFGAPTRVQELDIRGQSLPENVGAAARSLWDAGHHRGALALLYRGMLSRLIDVDRLPIRESTTEGECLALAARLVERRKREYASRLISVWQRFAYAGQTTTASTMDALCDDFAPALDGKGPLDRPRRQGAA